MGKTLAELQAEYDEFAARGLKLDLTRGKPSAEQLDLSNALTSLPTGHTDPAGTDVRNYGGLEGLPALRAIFSELLNVPTEQLLALSNASLTLMHDSLAYAHLWGVPGGDRPWSQITGRKFLCPTPGYDRHFTLCEAFGLEMIPVPNLADGPDVARIAELAASDPDILGVWLVPTYANPDGSVITTEAARVLAEMPAAAPDFRIYWDNAYAIHHLTDVETPSADILGLCAAAGNPNRALLFASTSKVTFPGAGVAFFGASPANVAWYRQHLSKQSIGPDKVNQLRHLEFFGDADGVRRLMAAHRAILSPKFAAVDAALVARFGEPGATDGITWKRPTGGYFVSLDVVPGTAARVVELAAGLGVALTPAGATSPYGRDPEDKNLRLSPSMPVQGDVEQAMAAVALCVELAAAEGR